MFSNRMIRCEKISAVLEEHPKPGEGVIFGLFALASSFYTCRYQCFVYFNFNIPMSRLESDTTDQSDLRRSTMYDGDYITSNG